MKKVNKNTRASASGKAISCPRCANEINVYHFSWAGIRCSGCEVMIKKSDWNIIDPPKNGLFLVVKGLQCMTLEDAKEIMTVTPEMISEATTLDKAVAQAEAKCMLDGGVHSDELEPVLISILAERRNSKGNTTLMDVPLVRYIPAAFHG